MLLGMTQVVFEGVPTYPDAGRAWAITDKYKVPCPALPCPALPCPALPCPALWLSAHAQLLRIQTCIVTKKEQLVSMTLALFMTMLDMHEHKVLA